MARPNRYLTGRARGARLVFVLLLLAVMIPTACVLWFMTEAMENERLAVRQRLVDACQADLELYAFGLQKLPEIVGDQLGTLQDGPQETLRTLSDVFVVGSAILYGPDGSVVYPRPTPAPTTLPARPASWTVAEHLEFEQRNHDAAAKAYGTIAKETANERVSAEALRAQARCLVKAGRTNDAIHVLSRKLAWSTYHEVRDLRGRLIVLDARLRALELMQNASHPDSTAVARQLEKALVSGEVDGTMIPSSQRRFLLRKLIQLKPGDQLKRCLETEDLAIEFLASMADRPPPGSIGQDPASGIYWLSTPDGHACMLWREEGFRAFLYEIFSVVRILNFTSRSRITLLSPSCDEDRADAFLSMPLEAPFQGWTLILNLSGDDPFAEAASRRIAVYRWTGILVTGSLCLVAGLIAWQIGRQRRLTRLKNELIATVSHELKTPLSSMRVLADTLLSGRITDEGHAREYVQLIARENARLSRLIDNFLTFSRMERGKRQFVFEHVAVDAIIGLAVEAVGDRFEAPECRLDVEIEPGLPQIYGDRDALVGVLINLLDNAHKYTDDHKEIAVRAFAGPMDGSAGSSGGPGPAVYVSVSDNGIGLSRRESRRVFDRFYQVDDRLSRRAEGCGLGLSIVRYIVEAHGGRVSVDSAPDQGSTFTVRLPTAAAATTN